jgi:hypothetical protein
MKVRNMDSSCSKDLGRINGLKKEPVDWGRTNL